MQMPYIVKSSNLRLSQTCYVHKQVSRSSHVLRTCAVLENAATAAAARRDVLLQISAAAALLPFVNPVSVLAATVSTGATVSRSGCKDVRQVLCFISHLPAHSETLADT